MAEEISMERKKEFIFRGKTLEELGKLDIREFAKLVPSRERRTMLRNTDVIEKFLSRCNKKNDRKKVIKTHNRNIIIVPAMIGMIVLIHNGKARSSRNWSYKVKCFKEREVKWQMNN